ncbi:hypothetical protein C9374_009533 [Naegleria lovaniensis]|uniref:alpha-1,2-Mannosidase n=1 Tax=Naegleria lovaniensis TaxID=51637 RepID=A0AA88H305_NAELO|nr:uncharacterized protein C9374_009533 [Naegleria lovaniensis]KAG2392956.1 hypothetical protein C9374_009533 [Naegleria lovaniensis]
MANESSADSLDASTTLAPSTTIRKRPIFVSRVADDDGSNNSEQNHQDSITARNSGRTDKDSKKKNPSSSQHSASTIVVRLIFFVLLLSVCVLGIVKYLSRRSEMRRQATLLNSHLKRHHTDDNTTPLMERHNGLTLPSVLASSTNDKISSKSDDHEIAENTLVDDHATPDAISNNIKILDDSKSHDDEEDKVDVIPTPMDESTDEFRRNAVKNAFLHAWRGYETYAWGHDEVRPLTNDSRDNFGNMAATVVDSLDTMIIMDLHEELAKARELVLSLNFNKDQWVSVFETTIRYIGGFLSAFDLTQDSAYLNKALELGERLLPAFHADSKFPHTEVNLYNGAFKNADWHRTSSILSEVGSIQLEFKYLSHHSGDKRFWQLSQEIMDTLDKQPKAREGLYPAYVTTDRGLLMGDHVTLGALGDSFFEYLLKQWLLTGEEQFHRMYREFVKGMKKHLLARSSPSNLVYIGELKNGQLDPKFDHLVCFVPGMLALGSVQRGANVTQEELNEDLELAKELTRTCYEIYNRQPTGIGCEIVNFSNSTHDFNVQAPFYILRPEAIESIFILYRVTKDPMYKEWGWNIFKSIEKHCKTPIAFAGLKNVLVVGGIQDNAMESYFMSETLKYLYLLFTDHKIPLDKYVFTTEAHPLSPFQHH